MGLIDRLRGSFISKNRTAKEWYDLAVQLAAEHKLQDTHEALKKALASTPQSAELCVMIALALEGLGDVETAIDSLKRACHMAPKSPQAQMQLGQLLLKHKRTNDALKPLREAVQLTDFAAEPTLKLASALEQENELEEALSHAHIAARQAPDNSEALRTLGRLQQKFGHLAGAIRTFRALRAIAPNDLPAMTSLGILLSEAGQHHDALQLLSAVVRTRPDVPEAYSDIALALSRSGTHDGALQAIKQALSLRPKSPQLLLNLATILKAAGQIEAAINTYWEVVGLAPDWATAHFNVAIALRERGDLAGARSALNKAAKLAPNNPEIQQALAELEKPALKAADVPHPTPAMPAASTTTKDIRVPKMPEKRNTPPPIAKRDLGMFADDLYDTQRPDDIDDDLPAEEVTKKKKVFPDPLALPPQRISTPHAPPPLPEPRKTVASKSITGEIEIFPLTEVLEFLKVHRSTGILLISSEHGHGELRMREGNLTGGLSPNTKDVITLLLSSGRIKETDINGRAKNEPPERVATKLLEDGLLGEDAYREACIAQIQSALAELITWKKGDFTFGADRSGTIEGAVSIDTRGALMDVLRKMDESRK